MRQAGSVATGNNPSSHRLDISARAMTERRCASAANFQYHKPPEQIAQRGLFCKVNGLLTRYVHFAKQMEIHNEHVIPRFRNLQRNTY